jgi:hypothetical protein
VAVQAGAFTFCDNNANTGVVMKVVTKAMITIIENKVGEITFRSPSFNITSSIKPRLFMSTPTGNRFSRRRGAGLFSVALRGFDFLRVCLTVFCKSTPRERAISL